MERLTALVRGFLSRLLNVYRDVKILLLRGKVAPRGIGKGLIMEIDPRDFMERSFYLGIYEPALILMIHHVVRRGDTCLDIGAQKGYVTLNLAKAVGASGRVLAFEPDPRAAEHLSRHCAWNHLHNVT